MDTLLSDPTPSKWRKKYIFYHTFHFICLIEYSLYMWCEYSFFKKNENIYTVRYKRPSNVVNHLLAATSVKSPVPLQPKDICQRNLTSLKLRAISSPCNHYYILQRLRSSLPLNSRNISSLFSTSGITKVAEPRFCARPRYSTCRVHQLPSAPEVFVF